MDTGASSKNLGSNPNKILITYSTKLPRAAIFYFIWNKMQLFYVEHSVVTKHRYALVAKDESDLKDQLTKRELSFRKVEFVSKIEKESYLLAENWDNFTDTQVWSGKL